MSIRKNKNQPKAQLKNSPIKALNILNVKNAAIELDDSQLQSSTKPELIKLLKQQQEQIHSLLQMVKSYKQKIYQFSKYEKVIQQLQHSMKQKKQYKQKLLFDRLFSFKISTAKEEPFILKQPKIGLTLCQNFNYTLYSESSTNKSNTSLNCTTTSTAPLKKEKSSHYFGRKMNERCQMDASMLSENSQIFNTIDYSKYHQNKQNNKQNASFTKPFQKHSYVQSHRLTQSFSKQAMQTIQQSSLNRVPSLQNLRRIKNCFKMLKS